MHGMWKNTKRWHKQSYNSCYDGCGEHRGVHETAETTLVWKGMDVKRIDYERAPVKAKILRLMAQRKADLRKDGKK